MFKMYNTDLITNITEEVTEYKRGNWINMIAPSDDEIKTVCENINIQEDFIRYALDPEERARIDYEEDDGTTLILADVPIIEKDEDQKEYSTIPVGFIIVRDEYFITVSLMENQVIRRMNPMKNKSVATYKKSRLVLQCLYVNSEIYLNLLKKINRENGSKEVPIYNNTEVISAIGYLEKISGELNRPIAIYIGVGSQEGSHDGYNITASYITSIASKPGIIIVAGTGNSGNYEGHVTGFIKDPNSVYTAELQISRGLKVFNLNIWVQKPNRMSMSIIAPSGESSGEFNPGIYYIERRKFYLTNTTIMVQCSDPENLTGHQLYVISVNDIVPGIWKINMKGIFVTNGRVDMWLSGKGITPEGTKFLNSNSDNTLTIPSTAENVITVAYYDSNTGAVMGESGRGFNTNQLINPDIATMGTNILTTSLDRKSVSVVNGSSAATAIVTGACALLLQWGIVDKNDLTLYSTKMRSLLIYSAERKTNEEYPNEYWGYGKLDLYNIFNIIGGNYRGSDEENSIYRTEKTDAETNNEFHEGELFFRNPDSFLDIRYIKYRWGLLNNG